MRTAIRTLVAIVLAVSLSIPAQAVTFGKIKYLVSVGDKVKEIKCHLILTKETIQIRDGKTARTLQELPYTEIQSVTYARSKHRRWKSGAGAALLLGPAGLVTLFMKGKKHWLTFEANDPDNHIGLRLDKKNYQAVVAAVEKRGLEIERIIED